MNLTRFNYFLAVLIVFVVTLTIGMDVDISKPNVEFMPEMKRSPAFNSYEATVVFRNGRTLQQPVEGTIALGHRPLYYASSKADAERAGEELENPYALGKAMDPSKEGTPGPDSNQGQLDKDPRKKLDASVERGATVYRVFCISCHGTGGAGDGPVTKKGFPPPPSLITGKSAQMKDGQLFHILTYGQGSMSPMAAQLNRPRRWDVINYVRERQRHTPVSKVENPTESPDQAESGDNLTVEKEEQR